MEIEIFDHFYNDIDEEPFSTVEQAAQYALDELCSDDMPYMIGYSDERGILAFVFQGQIYTIKR